jgi:hypothetical protein
MRCTTRNVAPPHTAPGGAPNANFLAGFRGITLDAPGFRLRYFPQCIDFKRESALVREVRHISHHGVRFRNANFLVMSAVRSYNEPHWLSRCGNLRMSPPPSS